MAEKEGEVSPPADLFADFIKVSSRDEIKRLAGRVAWNARRDDNKPILSSGAAAITTAITAIADARRFLGDDEQPIELQVQPAFRDAVMNSSLALYLTSYPVRHEDVTTSEAQLTVSKQSKPAAVAGAIAAKVREGVAPLLEAIGDEAIANALLAMCRARLYLEENDLDIKFIPTRHVVVKEGGDGVTRKLTSIRMKVYICDVAMKSN